MLTTLENQAYLPLNNLDLLDERGTPNPYEQAEYFFDESLELTDYTLDELYATATEADFTELMEGGFMEGVREFQESIPPYKTPEALRREGRLTAYTQAENVVTWMLWYVRNHRFGNTSRLSLLDRVQNGNLYLAEGMEKYDPTLGGSLLGMIKPLIANHLSRAERGGRYISSPAPIVQGDMIRIPDANGPYYKVREFHEHTNYAYGRQLDVAELAGLSNFTASDFEEYEARRIEYVPFHRVLGEDGEPTEPFIEGSTDEDPFVNPHEAVSVPATHEGIIAALSLLSEAQRVVLVARTGVNGSEGRTYTEITSELAPLSYAGTVSRYNSAIRKLSKFPHILEIISGERSPR